MSQGTVLDINGLLKKKTGKGLDVQIVIEPSSTMLEDLASI